MRIVLFGSGKYYQNRKWLLEKIISFEKEVVCFLDNNAEQIKVCDEKNVYNPQIILELEYDAIVLMSAKDDEMRKQLIELSVDAEKIYTWEAFLFYTPQGHLITFESKCTKMIKND